MNLLSEAELEVFEPHLLVCHICQARCSESEEIISMLQAVTLHESLAVQLRTRTERKNVFLDRAFSRNVFVSHGGRTICHVEKVRELLEALNFKPIVVMNMPNLGLSIGDKVRKWMSICRSAVVLATADDESVAVVQRTRPNVDHEVGMLQTIRGVRNRIVYLKEPTVKFASNYADKVWIEFDKNRIQDSFVPLIKEINAFSF